MISGSGWSNTWCDSRFGSPLQFPMLDLWTFGERKHSARQWLVMTSLMTELWKMKNSACLAGYLFTFYRLNGKKSKSLIHYWDYPVLTLPRPLSMIRHIHPLRYVHVCVFIYGLTKDQPALRLTTHTRNNSNNIILLLLYSITVAVSVCMS